MSAEQMVVYDFDRLLAQWPGLLQGLAAHIEEIRKYGGIKQAIAEADKRLADAKVDAEKSQAALQKRQEAAEADFAQRQIKMDEILKTRASEMEFQMLAARNDVNKVIEDGQKQKDRIFAEANVARAAVDQRVEDARKQALELEGTIGDMNAQILDLDTTIQAKQAELARVDKAISDLRAKIA